MYLSRFAFPIFHTYLSRFGFASNCTRVVPVARSYSEPPRTKCSAKFSQIHARVYTYGNNVKTRMRRITGDVSLRKPVAVPANLFITFIYMYNFSD